MSPDEPTLPSYPHSDAAFLFLKSANCAPQWTLMASSAFGSADASFIDRCSEEGCVEKYDATPPCRGHQLVKCVISRKGFQTMSGSHCCAVLTVL